MTRIIAAFPCLGKTTLYSLNKDKMFDREFNESRSVRGMDVESTSRFFDSCAEMVNLQVKTGYYDYLFITEDERLVSRLGLSLKNQLTLVFPNVFDRAVMAEYKKLVIERSGIEWYNRVMPTKLASLKERIQKYQAVGYD
ncbi:hypothetical protein RyT2_19170 [Pseudolactococcus yaeyamensis]